MKLKTIAAGFLTILFCLSAFSGVYAISNSETVLEPMTAEQHAEKSVIASGECGEGTQWTIYSDGELYISTIEGKSSISGFSSIPWNGKIDSGGNWVDSAYKEKVKTIVIDGIINLEYDKATTQRAAFEGMTSVKSITIKKGRGVIGFTLCTNLFKGCTALESVFFDGKSVTFNTGAFDNCTSLKTLIIPSIVNNVSTVSCYDDSIHDGRNVYEAFSGCDALTDIYYPGSKTVYKNNVKVRTSNGENKAFKNAELHTYYKYLPYSSFSIKYQNWAYTGKAVCPKVTVKTVSGTTLKQGTNYTVSFANNKDYGTATITVTGKGKYFGTEVLTFKIVPGKIKNLAQIGATKTSATISWDAHPYASKYEIRLRGPYGPIAGYTTSTEFTVTGLTSTQSVYVRAVVVRTDPETGETEEILGNASGTYVVLKK